MSGKDFIPGPDGEFDDFLKQFQSAVGGAPANFGLAAGDGTLIQAKYSAWSTAYGAHKDAQQKAHEAATTKDKVRADAEEATRGLAKKINGNAAVDNEMRAMAALPAHDLVKTAIGAPASHPVVRLEAKGHLTIVLHFTDAATPQRNAKPHGVHACEIRVHVGDPAPADETGYTFLANDTRTPYVDTHPAADAGKTAYYMVRWLNTKLEPGPWGDVVSMKIPV